MKYIEYIIIIGLVVILGFGTYFNTKIFFNKIEEQSSPIVEEIKEQEEQKEDVEEILSTSQQEPVKEEHETHLISLGVYKITAYCGCAKCCGKTDGITASGTHVTAGRTIAAPPEIPFGTKISINGQQENQGGYHPRRYQWYRI